MAEEHQTLVENELPQETVEGFGTREPRSFMCNKGKMVTALSVFVGILIVGQAVTVYFVTQQHSKISELTDTTNRMKLEELIKKLPGSPPDRKVPKMRMASINIPLVAEDPEHPRENLAEIAKASNKLEDAVKYFLLMGNPLRKYSSLNGTFLDNLRNLKKSMEEEQWAVFDAWMQQWYLFFLVQNTPSGNTHVTSGEPLVTPCQMMASEHVQLGAYKPQCDENGEFVPMQCWRGTGYCWCVYKNGTEVPETRIRAKPDCSEILEPSDTMEGFYPLGFDEMKV